MSKPLRFGYEQVRREIYRLKNEYPLAAYGVCGRSIAGRAIFTLSVGNSKNASLYVGGIHGGDTLGVLVLLRFFEKICSSLSEGCELAGIRLCDIIEDRGIIIVPCLNPDSAEINLSGASAAGCFESSVAAVLRRTRLPWDANAGGVDLNKNFNAGWYSLHKTEEDTGKLPESEPETKALVRLCSSRDIRHAMALFRGESAMLCHGFCRAENADMMAKILSASFDGELSFGNAEQPQASFGDWFVQKFSRPAFSVQPGNRTPTEAYNAAEELLALFAIM